MGCTLVQTDARRCVLEEAAGREAEAGSYAEISRPSFAIVDKDAG